MNVWPKALVVPLVAASLAGCLSLPSRIEQEKITSAIFSCVTPETCVVYSDGDIRNNRVGFLKLDGSDWIRFEQWGFKGAQGFGRTRLFFLNEKIAWGLFEDRLFRLSDDGKQWQSVAIQPPGILKDLFFLDPNHGWVTTAEGAIDITSDGGQNWLQNAIRSQGSLSAIFFLDTFNGWVILDGKSLLATHDGGLTWAQVGIGFTNLAISQLHFDSPLNGWAASTENGQLLLTSDGGVTWTASEGSPNRFSSVYYFDRQHGWAIEPQVGMVHTSDGGKTWAKQEIRNPWYDHPVNLVWKVPLYIIVYVPAVIIATIPDWLSQLGVTLGTGGGH